MTPKERAKYLFENYLILFPEFYNDLEYGYNDVKAKQCALILVNELIKETGSKYWYDVKQEIEKL
jgi:hypothetical protein